jgi:IclR family acetate operon transcriptional repressor
MLDGASMAVKPSQSASRVLAVLELIADHQPIGISDVAKLLDADKSAVQRALMTLAHEGWISAAPGKPTRWELTARIHAVAHAAHESHDLRHRARPMLLALRDATGETVCLNAVDGRRFIVVDMVESLHYLRVVLTVGMNVQTNGSSTGRAILPYVSRERQIEFLGGEPDARELAEFAATVARGYSVSSSVVIEGFTNIAAPIFEADRRPVAAIVVSGPSERLQDSDRIGVLVRDAARKLSRGPAPEATASGARLATA